MLELLAESVPGAARRAMEAFWPGPLTCVLPAAAAVPRTVTAGLDTVRYAGPGHPGGAGADLRSGVPGSRAQRQRPPARPSPTCAQDVWEDMAGRIPLILDGGPCGWAWNRR